MKTWRMRGSLARTVGDMGMSALMGTSLQPKSTCPSAWMARSNSCSQACLEACSLGRKMSPTPYSPKGGKATPCKAISSRYKASGIWIKIPAPSPINLSAPTAPRWSKFSKIFKAWLTMAWLLCPLMCATKPTPQASCSWLDWYKPWVLERIKLLCKALDASDMACTPEKRKEKSLKGGIFSAGA